MSKVEGNEYNKDSSKAEIFCENHRFAHTMAEHGLMGVRPAELSGLFGTASAVAPIEVHKHPIWSNSGTAHSSGLTGRSKESYHFLGADALATPRSPPQRGTHEGGAPGRAQWPQHCEQSPQICFTQPPEFAASSGRQFLASNALARSFSSSSSSSDGSESTLNAHDPYMHRSMTQHQQPQRGSTIADCISCFEELSTRNPSAHASEHALALSDPTHESSSCDSASSPSSPTSAAAATAAHNPHRRRNRAAKLSAEVQHVDFLQSSLTSSSEQRYSSSSAGISDNSDSSSLMDFGQQFAEQLLKAVSQSHYTNTDEVANVAQAMRSVELKSRALTETLKVLRNKPEGATASYAAFKWLISDEAARLFGTSYAREVLTKFSCTTLISCLRMGGMSERGIEVFDYLRETGCEINAHVFSAVLSACAASKRMDKAMEVKQLLDQNVHVRNVHTYTALLSCCEKCTPSVSDAPVTALHVLRDMRVDKIQPNAITYNSLVACLEKGGRHDDAKKVLSQMRSEGYTPSTSSEKLKSGIRPSALQPTGTQYVSTLGTTHVISGSTTNAAIPPPPPPPKSPPPANTLKAERQRVSQQTSAPTNLPIREQYTKMSSAPSTQMESLLPESLLRDVLVDED